MPDIPQMRPWRTVEVNVSSTPVHTGKFTITDSQITPNSILVVQQASGPYTGKGTLADEAEMDPMTCIGYPASGTATVRWRTINYLTIRSRGFDGDYGSGTTTTANPQDDTQARTTSMIVGKVKGNIKFNYNIN